MLLLSGGRFCSVFRRLLVLLAIAAMAPVVRAGPIPELSSAASRRLHGTVNYDIPLPLTGASGIECRTTGQTATIVLRFDQPITGGTAAVTAGVAQIAGAPTFAGNVMTVALSGVADSQVLTVTASNVIGAQGTLPSAAVTVRFLEGDVNANGTVTGLDVNIVRGAAATGVVDGFSYRSDLNGNGSVTGLDVNRARNRASSGLSVSGGATANTAPTVNDVADTTTDTSAGGASIALSIGDAESQVDALGVRARSSNQTLVSDASMSVSGSGAARTLTITPASGQTGTATITVEVGDGLTIAADTFVLTITQPPKLFTAYLRPEGSSVTPGSGFATLLLSGDEKRAELKASYSNLTTPEVAKHIHGPAGPSQSAGILFDIDTAEYNEATQSWRWDIVPVGAMTAAEVVSAIKSGSTYINIHSSQYPSGEIRGQFLLSTGSQTFTPPPPPPALPGGLPTAQDAARFLQQATYGPTSAEITRVQSIGLDPWLTEQFAMPLNKLVVQPANNSFETPAVGAGATMATPAGASWTFEGDSGVTGNGSALTLPVSPNLQINAPQLSQAAYIKATGRIRQSLNVGQSGKYVISFLAAPRTNAGAVQTLLLKVNGVLLATYPLNAAMPTSDPGRYNALLSPPITLTAGTHEISIEGTATGAEDTAFIDDVRIGLASSHYAIVRARLGAENNAITTAARNSETWWRNAITADDQLRQRVAFAYEQIFVVSAQDGAINGRPLALASYHDMLADNAFANFRTILREVTLHPIMGQYLNMRGNRKPFSPLFTAPNENYAREVLQLFSIGLNQLQPDGTLKLGPDGLPIPTYDQSVIEGFANVFTGWNVVGTGSSANIPTPVLRNVTVSNPDGTSQTVWRIQNYNDNYTAPMVVTANNVSNSAKKLLNGVTIAARATQTTATATAELDTAMDNIFNHPNVGPFIGRQLIQRMVTSNPSPAYVYRVAQVFDNDGSGVRGNMRAVIKAILTDYEARSTTVLGNQGFGKLREPVLRVTSAIRPFSPTSQTAFRYRITTTDTQLGQTPFRAPTVFNFYEPFYVHPGQLADNGLHAPEFQISTEIMAVSIPNFMRTGMYNASATTAVTFQGGDIRLNLAAEQAMAGNATNLVNHLDLLLMSGQMPSAMKTRVISQINSMNNSSNNDRLVRARFAVYLIASSSQCAVQR